MASSLPLSEQKACFGCATAKRACDKRKPSCQRCVERVIRCQYPTTRRYFRSRPAANAPSKHIARARLQGSAERAEINDHVTNLPTLDSSIAEQVNYKLWFMDLDAWTIENQGPATCRFSSGPSHGSPQLEDWKRSLWDWLRQWVDEGTNPFIHKQLYFDDGLPPCLEDAWTTLSSYFSKTASNKHVIMRIIEHRVDGLVQSQPLDDDPSMALLNLQTIQHLARVQALFIYLYLQLYDGCIRQRARAERYIPTLLLWCEHLWQSATLEAVCNSQLASTLQSCDRDDINDTMTSEHWKAWILSESLRRLWIVCTSTIAAYLRERDGWSDCSGEVRFTPYRGLWDASSSAIWGKLISNRDPLFIRSLHVDELLVDARPAEVDRFSSTLMRLILKKEDMEDWVRK